MNIEKKYGAVIAGAGVAGLFCALNLPAATKALVLSKGALDESDSYLAQGGICMLRGEEDFDAYFKDTMRAGHFENDERAVEQMIRSSPEIIDDLIGFGVEFARDETGALRFTREGGHSRPRILFHDDVTGREITSKLLREARSRKNISFSEYTEMLDIVEENGVCRGVVVRKDSKIFPVYADNVLLAAGGVGGLYENSTNFSLLTGDAVAIALKHRIRTQHLNYVQIHPTTFYSEKAGRRFLISESVRGEGAFILDGKGERFVNELLPRDIVTAAIYAKMKEQNLKHVWLDVRPLGEKMIAEHFPTIRARCLEEGYDLLRQPIPIVPAQHYFMGGIAVNGKGETSMPRVFAAGETACNGVHGKNRLASNSLLESLIWAKRAAETMALNGVSDSMPAVDLSRYENYAALKEENRRAVLGAMQEEEQYD